MKRTMLLLLLALMLALPGLCEEAAPVYDTVDVDLTGLDGDEIIDVISRIEYDPTAYLGQVVRMTGLLGTQRDKLARQTYFFVYVPAGASACCSSLYYGFDFIWYGQHAYPQDYSRVGDMTVTGVLDTYAVGGIPRLVLRDALVTWAP